ncbi:hypothetical protein ACLOJK_005063 [Asimina triloba]
MDQSDFLELTIVSAEDLRMRNRPIEKNAYATVRTHDQNRQSTTLDLSGGSFPSWNETLHLELGLGSPASSSAAQSSYSSSIVLEVHCRVGSQIKTVGTTRIPLSDVFRDYVPAHLMHFMSYRLKDSEGRRNGIINLKFRMVGPTYTGRSSDTPWACPVQESSKEAIGVPLSSCVRGM